jgi:serine/threonine protein kinase
VLHGDIKPGNILMNLEGCVKLLDFVRQDLAERIKENDSYMSPERLLCHEYDKSGDIWSVGITIVQLWTKRYPFSNAW